MTANEKAEHLIHIFTNHGLRNWYAAKECALICVDEIIRSWTMKDYNQLAADKIKFYNEVKKEISNL